MDPIILLTKGIQNPEQEKHNTKNTDNGPYSSKHSEIQQRREMQIHP